MCPFSVAFFFSCVFLTIACSWMDPSSSQTTAVEESTTLTADAPHSPPSIPTRGTSCSTLKFFLLHTTNVEVCLCADTMTDALKESERTITWLEPLISGPNSPRKAFVRRSHTSKESIVVRMMSFLSA